MKTTSPFLAFCASPTSIAALLLLVLLCIEISSHAEAAVPDANNTTALHARYLLLKDQLGKTAFQLPIAMESTESVDSVSGEIYAQVSYPFATFSEALKQPGNWCDILILHLNTKYCRPSNDGKERALDVSIGKKFDQPLEDAYRLNFNFRQAAANSDYLQVGLSALNGPLGTRNYRIVLEAMPLDKGRTFMRLSYAYDFGLPGRIAMQTYLGTVGSHKVGFTVVGQHGKGKPKYLGGMRGLVERNTMRYYLAIDAFMGAQASAPAARMEKRFQDWYASSERYPRQLHEMEQDDYMVMKRREYARQQVALAAPAAE